jgi:hypothetical protein
MLFSFYKLASNNLEHLRERIRTEMEQISPDIIERSVHQTVGEC